MTTSTPTEEIAANATKTYVVEDGARKITLRKPSVLAQYDFIEMLGAERAGNQTYVAMAMPTLFVIDIDGVPVPQPTKFSELRALLQRLGDSGIAAISKGMEEHFGEQKSPLEIRDSIKK
jgi:hypothetical protein